MSDKVTSGIKRFTLGWLITNGYGKLVMLACNTVSMKNINTIIWGGRASTKNIGDKAISGLDV